MQHRKTYYLGTTETENQINQLTNQLKNQTDLNQIKTIVDQIRILDTKAAFENGRKYGYSEGYLMNSQA